MEEECYLLPSPKLPTLGRCPLYDHNSLEFNPAIAPVVGIPSLSSDTPTPPTQPSLLNNRTPAPMLITYNQSRNVPAVPSLISAGAFDLPSPAVSAKGSGKENRGRRIVILGPKPPPVISGKEIEARKVVISQPGNGKENGGRRIVILGPKLQLQGYDLSASKGGLDPSLVEIGSCASCGENPSPLSHADKVISVIKAPALTSNPLGREPVLKPEVEGLPTLQACGHASLRPASSLDSSQKGKKRKSSSPVSPPVKIPSVAKKRRTDHARPKTNGKDNLDWIGKSATEVFTSKCVLGKLHDTASTRTRRTRPCAAKLTVSLSDEDIRKDFLLMTGQQPRQRPAKRPAKVQREIEKLFPGTSLEGSIVSMQRYNRKI